MSYTTRGELLAAASDAPQRANDRAEYIRAVIAAGVADAYRAPVFRGGFDKFVCWGDSITCQHDGFTIVARIEHDADHGLDDTDCFSTDRSSDSYSDGARGDEEYARAMEARAAYYRDEWHYCGVVLSVARGDVVLDKHAASLWGIECNYPGSDNSYLTVVAHELVAEALEVGREALETLQRDKAADAKLDAMALESMIDAQGLSAVLDSLSLICAEKAAHIRESYSDEQLGRAWDNAARYLQRARHTRAVQDVTP